MTGTELWLTYHQTSRVNKPSTAQLVELEFQNHKLRDLEDVLEHVFQQGFVEAKYRPVSYWERKDGTKVKGSFTVEELLKQGVGQCQDSALRLVIADIPPAVWFSYHYTSNISGGSVAQRIKLETLFSKHCNVNVKLAHVTNHIFGQGFLPCQLRSKVFWEGICGKRVEEHFDLVELLKNGEGVNEEKTLRLIIDDRVVPSPPPVQVHCHGPTYHQPPVHTCSHIHYPVSPSHCHCA